MGLVVLWLLLSAAIPVIAKFDHAGWDVRVYRNAISSLRAGHDPYLDAMAVQDRYHREIVHPAGDPPFSYVYSPITLPLLRAVDAVPAFWSGLSYWSIFVLGVVAELWVGLQAVTRQERRIFLYVAPLTIFFPGLLANGIVLGGNVAYILYGGVFLAATYGWRRNRWVWFYLAVAAASCVKAPLLSLVVIPVLSARHQWLATIVTAAGSLALFATTPLIWPDLFRHYLRAVDLQFSFNRDFGCSPAGLFSNFLLGHGIAYSPAGIYFYLAYAVLLFGLLLYLSRRFLAGAFPLQQWAPVLLVGVILLNPRILEYDLAAVTLPLALIAWRGVMSLSATMRTRFWCGGAVFCLANLLALQNWTSWKLTGGLLLVSCFVAGCFNLVWLTAAPREYRTPNESGESLVTGLQSL